MYNKFKDSFFIEKVYTAITFCKFKSFKMWFNPFGLFKTISPDSRTKKNTMTLLMHASKIVKGYTSHSEQEKILLCLLKRGADPNLASCSGFRALHYAVNDKLSNVIELLVKNGADTNRIEFTRGLTPLMLACRYGYSDIAIKLIELGSDVKFIDYYGFSAIDYAKDNKLDQVVDILTQKGCEILINPEFEINEIKWYSGATTWEDYAVYFSRAELWQNQPDFKDLIKRIDNFSPEEKHGIWIRLGGNCNEYDRNFAAACYLEALWNDPNPNSLAWGWLNGEYDKDIILLRRDSPRNKKTIIPMREKWGIEQL